MERPLSCVLAVLALVLPALAAGGAAADAPVVFRHRGGNAWWVEVAVDAPQAPAAVHATVDGAAWHALEKRSWGNWAGSFEIPSGALVRFRATLANGTRVESCPFTHPGGEERCGGAPAGPFEATFRTGGGNEWWVPVRVSANAPLAGVDARVGEGAWKPLTLRSWGEWAASFHVPSGSLVQFRARAASGEEVSSGWHVWPSGAQAQPPPPLPAPPLDARRLAVFGDTGTGPEAASNVNGSLAEGATGFVGLGDYAYEASPSSWLALFDPLLRQGAWLAIGNHDNASDYPPHFANGTWWSDHVGGARVAIMDSRVDMRPGSVQHAAVRAALCNAPEEMRILAAHHPWWLLPGAVHPGHEFPASAPDMDALVRECGVDLVLAGHEHNYQRALRQDVPHVIVGTGGRPTYPLRGMPEGTLAAHAVLGRLVLDVNATGFAGHFRSLDGRTLDAFVGGNATAAPGNGTAPAVHFDHVGGNEWWVEVKLSGADAARVVRITARDEGMSGWQELPKRSWGAWAGSFRIEPGHRVRFHATLSDGSLAESCWHTHPAGEAQCGDTPPPAFGAAFPRVAGNEWWIQAKVSANRPLAGVDARVDAGAWRPLKLQSWGEWAASFHLPTGSDVQLRARSADGAEALSATWRWPPG